MQKSIANNYWQKKGFDVDDMNDFKNLKEILKSGQKII